MIQEKLGLNGALKICKFWNNGALNRNHLYEYEIESLLWDFFLGLNSLEHSSRLRAI